jgi:hypothetical protein
MRLDKEKDATEAHSADQGLNGANFNERGTIMSEAMSPTEFLAIYNTLDESRKQELVDHALELIEEQRGERRTEQRV